MAEMTKEVIVASCKANGGYAAPHLNDQLFLHCKGFTAIQNLAPYRDVKVLWLEQNALSELGGLEAQKEALVSLFVQNNFIRSLTSLTATLNGLRVLNVSHNYLTSLRGIAAACPFLETLQASHNQLTSLEVCEELWQLAGSLTSVDLSFNRIETCAAPMESPADAAAPDSFPATRSADDDIHIIDPADGREVMDSTQVAGAAQAAIAAAVPLPAKGSSEDALALVHFFQRLPLVSVVYMQGNGLAHRLRSYRRNMILHLPALTYLDERPVFPEERRVVEAWGRGGEDAEAAERAAIREEKRAHLTQCVKVLTEQRDGQKVVRDRLTRQFEQRRARELEELTQCRRRDRDNRAALESAEDVAREEVEKMEQDARWDVEDVFRTAHERLSASEPAHRHAYEHHIAVTRATQEAVIEEEEEGEGGAAAPEQLAVDVAAAVKVLEDAGSTTACADILTQRRSSIRSRNGDDGNDVVVVAAPPSAGTAPSALAELLQSDDAVLREMESEIEHVLYDLGAVKTNVPSSSVEVHAAPATATMGPALPAENEMDETLPASYSSGQMTDRTTLRMERNVRTAVGHVASQLKAQQCRRSSGHERESVWQRFEQWEARRASLPTKD
ncbi:hypothetical protein ABB37_01112 [Leptomonas pyrrhocoris]|uniref:Uncharacterized protein n=1 Tax=Leptomonas pyrrhocoris TaxID=157538 RepID=A0A0N0VH55_LEPPY|nr:hypothetical protein ABB37_01112 [Leptomonas pyrrhocoris]XP_015663018.1 hypothetical protein ABB37_01112 [Leptomonas pyrrhocoris]KPA84578.1 hypothetical protein ABB37_01112 [Leptomonas pyrrhocoris]KPA84579.1 hypothetical protein ABB37_01112 [Leptomonas pyrrhocoris]|eukprot:XP_015663017.1 hypothetical protein ABB37_01112 [Leptomonas pyrrhocoris]